LSGHWQASKRTVFFVIAKINEPLYILLKKKQAMEQAVVHAAGLAEPQKQEGARLQHREEKAPETYFSTCVGTKTKVSLV
jgi:hypothetical protein